MKAKKTLIVSFVLVVVFLLPMLWDGEFTGVDLHQGTTELLPDCIKKHAPWYDDEANEKDQIVGKVISLALMVSVIIFYISLLIFTLVFIFNIGYVMFKLVTKLNRLRQDRSG